MLYFSFNAPKLYDVSPVTLFNMNTYQQLYVAQNNTIFLCMNFSRWENPGIDVCSIPGICQPGRKSPGIDFAGNRSLDAPVLMEFLDVAVR